MKGPIETVMATARKGKDAQEKMNLLREALHHLILQEVDRKGGFAQICFLGGTALRLVYGLDRFSEDLDFSTSVTLERPFRLETLVRSVETSLRAFGFACEVEKLGTERNVQKCFFSFQDILNTIDSSFRKQQKLAVKFDVDTRPPDGAIETVSPITGIRVYKVRHYDLPSLFAGKLHAILYRGFTKGRDLYDFLWYTGRQTKVNVILLKNAIEQTEGKCPPLTTESLRELLLEKFQSIDFAKAKQDVGPFLENPESLNLFARTVFEGASGRINVS